MISPLTASELCQYLYSGKHKLISLNLAFCELKHAQINHIFSSLATNNHVQKLSVAGNDTYEQSEAIGRCLLTNTTLQELDLSSSSLAVITATLVEALIATNSLTSIKLRGNKLGDVGALAIAHVLQQRIEQSKTTVTHNGNFYCFDVDIALNRITDLAHRALLDSILSVTTDDKRVMNRVDVSRNFFTESSITQWQTVVNNRSLKVNHLFITDFTGGERYYEPCDGVTVT